MVNSQIEIDLITHCIEYMSNKEDICQLFKMKGIKYPSSPSFKKLAAAYNECPQAISLDEIRDLFRKQWNPCDFGRHIDHLKSGLLKGHNWHGARPSMLHLSIQDRVRECCDGRISLEEFLELGSDIMKHEYFMVASHDICETAIIRDIPSVIPPIGNKSVTDFIYGGIPYDLKITSHPDEWKHLAGKMTLEEKKSLAFELYKGADSDRMRKMAEGCRHNWGLNRMYYLVSDQDKWLSDPEGVVGYLLNNLNSKDNCFDIEVHGFNIHICMVEQ